MVDLPGQLALNQSLRGFRKLVQENKIEGYSLPQGQLSLLFREIGRGSPGLISMVGKNTYVDPRLSGGKLNSKTSEDVVDMMVDFHFHF